MATTNSMGKPLKYGSYHRLVDYFIVCGLNKSIVVNQINKPYQSEILERFPPHNHEDAPLPPHIWMFCFPTGLYLKTSPIEPTISMFCLTEMDGARFYASSLVYYQQIPSTHVEGKFKILYTPVSINLLSRYPCYSILKELLCYIYLYGMSEKNSQRLPLERIISNVLNDMPRPLAGYRMEINLPTLILESKCQKISGYAEGRGPKEYKLSSLPTFAETDIPLQLLFYMLGITNVLRIFSMALHERKILFLSKNPSLLTIACETISTLLYPFSWPHVYIPILPELLGDFLQAPTPFIVGMIITATNQSNTNHFLNADTHPDITVVNLDMQLIHFPSTISHSLPEIEGISLEERLKSLLFPELVDFSIAFPYPPPANKSITLSQKIQSVFLGFFVSYFNDLDECLYLVRKYPKPITTFNKSKFLLKHQNPDVVTFLSDLIETSSISTFFDENYLKNDSFFYLVCKYYKKELKAYQSQNQSIIFGDIQHSAYDSIIGYLNLVAAQDYQYRPIVLPPPDDSELPVTEQKSDSQSEKQQEHRHDHQRTIELNENLFSKRFEFSKSLVDLQPVPSDVHSSISVNSSSGGAYSSSEKVIDFYEDNEEIQDMVNSTFKRSSVFVSSSAHAERLTQAVQQQSSDDQLELLKDFIQKSIDVIFEETEKSVEPTIDPEQQKLLIELLALKNARLYFINSLNFIKYKKSHHLRVKWKLSLFEEIVKRLFLECDKSADFKSASTLLDRCKDIYVENQDPIYNKFTNQRLWKNTHFWESCYFDHLLELRAEKLAQSFHDYRLNDWEAMDPDRQKEAQAAEEEIVFQSLSAVAYLMIKLRVTLSETTRFLGRMSLLSSLSEEHQSTLDALVDKIHKVTLESTSSPTNSPSIMTPATPSKRSHQRNHSRNNQSISDGMIPYSFSNLEDIIEDSDLEGSGGLPSISISNSGAGLPGIRNSFDSKPADEAAAVSGVDLSGKYFTTSAKRNIEIEKDIAKQYYQKLIEIKRKKSVSNLKTKTISKAGDLMSGSSGSVMADAQDDTQYPAPEISSEKKDGYGVVTLKGSGSGVTCVAVHSKPQVIINGTTAGCVMIWSFEDGKFLQRLTNHKSAVTCLGIGQYDVFSSGSRDKTLRIYNYDGSQWACTSTLQEHTAEISCLDMKRNTIITGSYDASMIMWDVRTNRKIKKFTGHTGNVMSALLLQNGETAITTSSDTTARVWDLRTMKTLHVLSEHNDWVTQAVMGEGSILYTGGFDSLIKEWDINTGKANKTLSSHAGGINALSYNSKSKILISGSGDGYLKAWDVRTGYIVKSFKGHKDEIRSILYEGDTLVTSSQDQTIRVWDINTGICQKILRGHTDWVVSLTSPKIDAPLNKFVSASWDSTVKMWDIGSINTQIEMNNSGSIYFPKSTSGSASSSASQSPNPPNPISLSSGNIQTIKLDTVASSPSMSSSFSYSPQFGSLIPAANNNGTLKRQNNQLSNSLGGASTSPTVSPSISPPSSSPSSSSIVNSPSQPISTSPNGSISNSNNNINTPLLPSAHISSPIVATPIVNSLGSSVGSNSSGMSSKFSTPSSSFSTVYSSSSTSSSSSSPTIGWQFGSPTNRNEKRSSEKLLSINSINISSNNLKQNTITTTSTPTQQEQQHQEPPQEHQEQQ